MDLRSKSYASAANGGEVFFGRTDPYWSDNLDFNECISRSQIVRASLACEYLFRKRRNGERLVDTDYSNLANLINDSFILLIASFPTRTHPTPNLSFNKMPYSRGTC